MKSTGKDVYTSQLQHDLTRVSRSIEIVATLGPDSNNVQLLEDIIYVGDLNVVRFNFNHGTPEFREEDAHIVCEASKRVGQEIAILADLQGSEICVGKVAGGSIELNKGEMLILDAALEDEGTRGAVSLDYHDLPNDVVADDVLRLDDGLLTLTVKTVEGSKVITRIENGHVLKGNKGINKCDGGLPVSTLTEKDFRDLRTATAIDCDYLTISFMRSAEDLHIARAKVEEEMKGGTAVRPGLVSKIERIEAIESLGEIILAGGGVMVTRGGSAVEIGHAAVPALQKRMVRRVRELRRFSITTTQMMESMITNPVPTRAEVNDVASTVLDGTGTMMCSAEIAVSAYSFETVDRMTIICATAEKEQDSLDGVAERVEYPGAVSTNLVIAGGMVSMARAVHAKTIVALTESGSIAFKVNHHNITLSTFTLTPSVSTQYHMVMHHGVRPLILAISTDHDTTLNEVEAMLVEHKILQSGDQYVITSGSKMRESSSTNTLEVLQVK